MIDLSVVDERKAADLLCLSVITLRNWRSQSKGPAFSKAGRRVVYRVEDLARWLEQNRVNPEAGNERA